jgi:membrane protein implicated in regulation of membrane protease activity
VSAYLIGLAVGALLCLIRHGFTVFWAVAIVATSFIGSPWVFACAAMFTAEVLTTWYKSTNEPRQT